MAAKSANTPPQSANSWCCAQRYRQPGPVVRGNPAEIIHRREAVAATRLLVAFDQLVWMWAGLLAIHEAW